MVRFLLVIYLKVWRLSFYRIASVDAKIGRCIFSPQTLSKPRNTALFVTSQHKTDIGKTLFLTITYLQASPGTQTLFKY